MLITDQQYVLQLLRVSVKGTEQKPIVLTDNCAVANIIIRNSILLTVFQKLPATLKSQFNAQYLANIKQSIVQEYEGEQVLKALGNAGLSCIALKGWELRKLYPEPMMRQMADLDILVRPYDFNTIKKVMEKQGYSASVESSGSQMIVM